MAFRFSSVLPLGGSRLRAVLVASIASAAVMLTVASRASAVTYFVNNSTANMNTGHCYTQYGSAYDADLASAPTNFRAFTLAAVFACSPQYFSGATLAAGTGRLDVWFTNTNKKSCTTAWFLQHNAVPNNIGVTITGTSVNGNGPITVPAGTTTPTKFTYNINVPATTLGPGDQLMLIVDVATRSGSCSNMTLYYGSATTASDIDLPTLLVV